ncbi:MAG: DJ-1/PfpI family protein [Thermoleophilia bacterium]
MRGKKLLMDVSVMNLTDRTLGIIVGPGFDESQVVKVAQELRMRGARVIVIGLAETEAMAVAGLNGSLLKPDAVISRTNASGLDAVIIPGGDSTSKLKTDDRVLTLVLEMNSTSKPIGVTGNGTLVLGAAGLLANKRVTGDPGIKEEVEKSGALYLSQGVVVDHNLVTSRADTDLPHFVDTITFLLEPATTKS